jgi:hypothetical protein
MRIRYLKKAEWNERKVGYALIAILENWETAFQTMDGGSKYNKNSVLETMRNYTNLTTKDIRSHEALYNTIWWVKTVWFIDFSCKTNYGIFIVITIFINFA